MIASDSGTQVSRSGFLAAVRASGLLTDAQHARAVAGLPAGAVAGADVAARLVAAGVLTRFQADRLLAGRASGFVIGQYVILAPLGAGADGRVYQARHRTMNRLVALKVLAAEHTRDPARRAAFQAECRAAAQLAHPNVVTVLDANQIGDRLYLVLEHVDGAAADAVVRAGGPQPTPRACEFARQAALGLQHAHEKGVPHGRVCPSDLLVGRAGGAGPADRPTVKVSNFGLGRVADGGRPAGVGCDPADYQAPELADPAAAPTPQSDLYSLGCSLYFLLTGWPPFPGGTAADKARRHRSAAPPAVEALRPDVPPAVAGLIRALLAKDPAARPASAAEVAARLEPFAEVDGARIDFNLPAAAAGPASYTGGYLSALHAPSPSGSAPQPAVRVEPPPAEPSPWDAIDNAATLDVANGETPVATRRAAAARSGARSGFARAALLVLAVLMTTGALATVGFALRMFAVK